VAPIPTKMTASPARYAAARPWAPAVIAPSRIANSLKNGANGGEPVMARKATRKTGPDTGSTRAAPRTCSVCFVPKARWMFPAERNSTPFVSPL